VELVLPDGTALEAEVTREHRDRLNLRRGLEVSVFLRKARVFVGDAA
jgi:sulfate transport system ATP-binding protein